MKQPVIFLKLLGMFILSVCSSFSLFSQQVLVNREWSTADSTSYFFQKSIVKTDANGLIYTLGSKMTATNGYDFLLLKQKSNGDTVYIASFDGEASKDDFAADLFIAPSGSVYIVGASWQNSSDSLDPVIVKLSSTGAFVWRDYLTNSSSYGDALVSITSDGGDKIFAGGTVSNGTDQDYILAKYDTSGTSYFEVTYDNNFQDIGVRVQYDAINSVIHLLGASQPTDTTWDFCIRRYNPSTGTALKTYRSAGGTIGIDVVSGIEQSNGNYFITGSAKNTSTGYDMVAICLDDSLDLLWTHTWNGADSLDDKSNAIRLDGNGNVYISGYTTTNSRGRDMILQKLDKSTGSVIWQRMLNGPDDGHDSGTDIEINGTDVFVTGYTTNGDQVFSTECYDIYGTLRWQKMSNTGVFGIIPDMAVDVEGNPVIGVAVFGLLYVEKYTTLNIPDTVVTDTSGTALFKANEIIVSFHPSKVNTAFVDDKDRQFASIEDVIDSTLIDEMEIKLGVTLRQNRTIHLVKIFHDLTTSDTISVSRGGHNVRIPPFWSVLRFCFPSYMDELSVVDSLNTIDGIEFSEPNGAFQLAGTNDPTFNSGTSQSSLHYTATYPDAHINVDSVWTDYEIGQDWVKIGIYDNGIYYIHEDFDETGSGGVSPGSFTGSKIKGGKNFDNVSVPVTDLTNTTGHYDHGTYVAGIIGAIRNNATGIAGISGGDSQDSSKFGAQLYDMVVCCNVNGSDQQGYITTLADAMVEGARSGTNSYNGLHILNLSIASTNSWGELLFNLASPFVRDNEVIMVVARGNVNSNSGAADSTIYYPACLPQKSFFISVGASGTNGRALKFANNNGTGGGGSPYTASGRGMDFLAPGATLNVTSTSNTNQSSYGTFGGTSSATAHVTGAIALMLSNFKGKAEFPDNLNIEDIEHILAYTADNYSSPGNYTYEEGWGKINVKRALDVLQKPYYSLLHFTAWSDSSNLLLANSHINPPGWVLSIFGNQHPDIYPTSYNNDPVDKFRITGEVYHNQFISSNAQILGYWVRDSYSDAWGDTYGTPPYIYVDGTANIEFLWFDTTYAILSGFVYYRSDYLQWIPYDPGVWPVRLSYSIHVYDSTGVTYTQNYSDKPELKIYPNPVQDQMNVSVYFPQPENALFEILDIAGKVVYSTKQSSYPSGANIVVLPVHSLVPGTYILRLKSNRYAESEKFIKN